MRIQVGKSMSICSIHSQTYQFVDLTTAHSSVRDVQFRWDGDKIRGVKVDFHDESVNPVQCGRFDDSQYPLTGYIFGPEECLTSVVLTDSGYGYSCLRQITICSTDKGTNHGFTVGPGGFDHKYDCAVSGRRLTGFYVWLQDNYVKGIEVFATLAEYNTVLEKSPMDFRVLVQQFAPVLVFQEGEAYWHANVDSFLTHMIMTCKDTGTFIHNGEVGLTKADLVKGANTLIRNNSESATLRTIHDLNQPSDTQDWFNGNKEVPITSYVVVSSPSDTDFSRVNITYWWFFNYNQGKTVGSTSWGNHVADWTYCKISLEKTNNDYTIKEIMWDHHGNKIYRTPGQQIDYVDDHPVVYVAQGSHECYPNPGSHSSDIFLVPDDQCSDLNSGIKKYTWKDGNSFEIYYWSIERQKFINYSGCPNSDWLSYKGRWGNWERGSLFGQVARLESGPEGLWRPQEYAL